MRGIHRGSSEEPLAVGLNNNYSSYCSTGEEYHHHHIHQDAPSAVKTTRSPRPTTPAVLATDGGGGGFWLASVATGPGMEAAAAATETGFISSQPSMAEFMTALPQMSNDPGTLGQHSPSGSGPMSPNSAAHHAAAYHGMMDGMQDATGVNVPEYPWMKEKKTTRKSSQQGKLKILFSGAPEATARVIDGGRGPCESDETSIFWGGFF